MDVYGPIAVCNFKLPSGKSFSISKIQPYFKEYFGPDAVDSYGGKPLIDLDGKPVFAEIAQLLIYLQMGWAGVGGYL